jgi:hypothetical protein
MQLTNLTFESQTMAGNIESMNPKAELVNTMRRGSGPKDDLMNAAEIGARTETDRGA